LGIHRKTFSDYLESISRYYWLYEW